MRWRVQCRECPGQLQLTKEKAAGTAVPARQAAERARQAVEEIEITTNTVERSVQVAQDSQSDLGG